MVQQIDNSVVDRGVGSWIFDLYKPEEFAVGPIEGRLMITKDWHCVVDPENVKTCFINIPSQNVAFAVDSQHFKRIKKTKSQDKE